MKSKELTSLDRYRLLGRSGLKVSPLCLGTMTFGTEWGWGSDKDESRRIFDAYVDRGGNFIDTANYYTGGTSEKFIGEFVRGRRDRLVIATKYTLNMRKGDPNAGGNHRKNIRQSIEASLERLQTDYIDLYWLHMWEYLTPVDEVLRALDDLVRAGKVLYIGVSDTPAWKVSQANTLADLMGWSPFIALQIEYSLIERTPERDLLPMARELGLGVTPWSPLGSGVLTGKYTPIDRAEKADSQGRLKPDSGRLSERNQAIAAEVKRAAAEVGCSPAQAALNWLLQKRGVTSPIIGARTLEQLEDNLGALDCILPSELMERLDKVSAVDMGFPHQFLSRENIRDMISGGAIIDPDDRFPT